MVNPEETRSIEKGTIKLVKHGDVRAMGVRFEPGWRWTKSEKAVQPDRLGPEQIRHYQLHLVETRRNSWSVFNQTVCALRFFYGVCLKREWTVPQIPFPKQPRKLPSC